MIIRSFARYKEDLITTVCDAVEFFNKFIYEFPELSSHILKSVYVYERNPTRCHAVITEYCGQLYKTRFRGEEYWIDDENIDYGEWYEDPVKCETDRFSDISSLHETEIQNYEKT